MSIGNIMDVVAACQSFPDFTNEVLVGRSYLLDTVENILDGRTQVLVLEGEEGIGKTTFLAEFARRHPNQTVSLFLYPTTRYGYDTSILRYDLCNQLQWLLRQQELDFDNTTNDSLLRQQIGHLMRRAKREQTNYFFILDGIDEIPEAEKEVRRLILDLLPFGLPGFKFLLSGDQQTISGELGANVYTKSFTLPLFSRDETHQYLAELPLSADDISEIQKVFRGMPAKLATIKRLLKSDSVSDVEDLLNTPHELSNLFDIEWNRARLTDDSRMLLAIAAFSRTDQTINSLGSIVGHDEHKIRSLLSSLSFIDVDLKTSVVAFVSESFRKYVITKLNYLEHQVYQLMIERLFAQPHSHEAQSLLPIYLQKTKRLHDLVEYLSPTFFENMLAHTQSYRPLRNQAQLGLKAALEETKDADAVRFAIHQAVLTELMEVNVWESEIQARTAVGDYESAIALAQSVLLKEDRLHLLTLVAKARRESGAEPEEEIIKQIEQLVAQLKDTDLGERAVDIATDLVHVNPRLALELVENTNNEQSPGESEHALDWAFLRLSLAAIDSTAQDDLSSDQSSETFATRIHNPKLRRFAIATSLLVEDYPASTIIREAEKLELAGDRIFFLRKWLLKNREREDAAEVVDFALNILIKTTEYSPTALDYREIASPLPYIKDLDKTKKFLHWLNGQKGTIEHLGPTIEFLRLQLLLAETEIKYDLQAASDRLMDIYVFIDSIEDLAVKAECTARLASVYVRIDPTNLVKLALTENVESDLHQITNQLLTETAHHEIVFSGTLRALGRGKFQEGLELACSLNTERRRVMGLIYLIDSILLIPIKRISFSAHMS